RQLGLAELVAGLQRPGHDRLAQLPGDDRGGGLPADRFNLRHVHRNRAPNCSARCGNPARRSPSHTVTWFAVSTGLPMRCSILSITPVVGMAVSGINSASASAWSLATASATT